MQKVSQKKTAFRGNCGRLSRQCKLGPAYKIKIGMRLIMLVVPVYKLRAKLSKSQLIIALRSIINAYSHVKPVIAIKLQVFFCRFCNAGSKKSCIMYQYCQMKNRENVILHGFQKTIHRQNQRCYTGRPDLTKKYRRNYRKPPEIDN